MTTFQLNLNDSQVQFTPPSPRQFLHFIDRVKIFGRVNILRLGVRIDFPTRYVKSQTFNVWMWQCMQSAVPMFVSLSVQDCRWVWASRGRRNYMSAAKINFNCRRRLIRRKTRFSLIFSRRPWAEIVMLIFTSRGTQHYCNRLNTCSWVKLSAVKFTQTQRLSLPASIIQSRLMWTRHKAQEVVW